jgi:hypothetical protein
MAVEDDQSTWLPKPPPPRAVRRDAAIDAALRKFDGVEEVSSPPAARPRPSRSWMRRPQLAVAMSAMFVLIVGVPAALIGLRDEPHRAQPSSSIVAEQNEECAGGKCAPPAATGLPQQPSIQAQKPVATADHAAPAPVAVVTTDASPSVSEADSKVVSKAESAPAEMVAPRVAPPAPANITAAPPPPAPPPPPPPPPPAAERSAEVASDIVLTGTRISNRAAQASSAARVTSGQQGFTAFLSRLQAATGANDRRAIVRLVAFPLRVNAPGGTRIYRDAPSVERDFDQIFTAKVRRAILGERPGKLFVRDQGAMIGNGELWFDQVCRGPSCSVRITAVNP